MPILLPCNSWEHCQEAQPLSSLLYSTKNEEISNPGTFPTTHGGTTVGHNWGWGVVPQWPACEHTSSTAVAEVPVLPHVAWQQQKCRHFHRRHICHQHPAGWDGFRRGTSALHGPLAAGALTVRRETSTLSALHTLRIYATTVLKLCISQSRCLS